MDWSTIVNAAVVAAVIVALANLGAAIINQWTARSIARAQLATQEQIERLRIDSQRQIEELRLEGQRRLELDKALRDHRRSQVEPYREHANTSFVQLLDAMTAALNGDQATLDRLVTEAQQAMMSFTHMGHTEVEDPTFRTAMAAFTEAANRTRSWLASCREKWPQWSLDSTSDIESTMAEVDCLQDDLGDALLAVNRASTDFIFFGNLQPSATTHQHTKQLPSV